MQIDNYSKTQVVYRGEYTYKNGEKSDMGGSKKLSLGLV